MGIQIADSSAERFVPFGYTVRDGIVYFCTARACRTLSINLYKGEKPVFSAAFSPQCRAGGVWRIALSGLLQGGPYSYTYTADGVEIPDPYGLCFCGRPHWGRECVGAAGKRPVLRARLMLSEEGAQMSLSGAQRRKPIPYEDSIIYRLHVRGFTKDRSAGLPARLAGTFDGITAKLPYLRELGVTTLELMPPYEFSECMALPASMTPPEQGAMQGELQGQIRHTAVRRGDEAAQINYWGFTEDALRLSPRESFGGEAGFRRLVRAVHEAGMELLVDLYFSGREEIGYVLDTLRRWHLDLGADGVHLIGFAPLEAILRDPYLKEMKLLADEVPERLLEEKGPDQTGRVPEDAFGAYTAQAGAVWGSEQSAARGLLSEEVRSWTQRPLRRAADCNDGFLFDMRRFLKGDSGMAGTVIERICANPRDKAVINYMANVSGFSMMDMLSYNYKHNEENGEQNRDGTEENASWNCGIEGPSRKKAVRELRLRLYKNAILLTLLSQGTPLILAGDEMGHTRRGNNNPWCQDNKTEWLDWRDLARNEELFSFMRAAIWLRKRHAVFRRREACLGTDYRSTGLPDISFHGESAWKVEQGSEVRQIAVLYSGAYARSADGTADDDLYICCNMHWRAHCFSLPPLPKERRWYQLLDTSEPFTKAQAEAICGGFIWHAAEQEQKKAPGMIRQGEREPVTGETAPEAAEKTGQREDVWPRLIPAGTRCVELAARSMAVYIGRRIQVCTQKKESGQNSSEQNNDRQKNSKQNNSEQNNTKQNNSKENNSSA